jgi:hypothetical protein
MVGSQFAQIRDFVAGRDGSRMTPRRHWHVSRGGSAPLRRTFLPLLAIRLFFYSFLSHLPGRAIRRRVAA